MKCPACGHPENKVLDSRSADEDTTVRRRRECLACGYRFTTYEKVETLPLMVCKRDNSREPFNRQKILNGLLKACQKRPVSIQQMEHLIDSIEAEFQNNLNSEVTTAAIGETIMNRLRAIDEVAYVRFVSVYRQFEDIDSFLEVLNSMKENKLGDGE